MLGSHEGKGVSKARHPAADRHVKAGPEEDVAFLPLVGVEACAVHGDAALAAAEPKGAGHRRERLEHVVEAEPAMAGTVSGHATPQGESDRILVRLHAAIG